MIEYPHIESSQKSPREECIAFFKYDGSNIRVKWTDKKGFCSFGSRTRLIDKNHPFLGEAISIFMDTLSDPLEEIFLEHFPKYKEIIVFGEYFGENSFAGWHVKDEPHKIIVFDVLLGNKNREFVKPDKFIDIFSGKIEIPRVIYRGKLTDEFIADVRANKFNLKEGVVCKGIANTGSYRGKMWQCKIKTQEYLDKLKVKFGNDWKKYGE